ncbi:MAG: hypothetical protein KBC83_02745 [Candidatus Moranbacteria bacterium]|jgi:tetratricopeptide (TPR) repeat protein|nr:hypothetical protein [Candidatus Moranbacteria bacterium]MBP9801556.1 hypothetical protein [Candidatus Moranbacteria bacterium]
MWHLIAPPIVVVACFVFIVWYLSRRGADPGVADQVDAMNDTQESALRLRVKIFSLRVVEKLAQRFKLLSLRVYNGIHVFLQSVKEKRKLSDIRQQEIEIAAQEKISFSEDGDQNQSDDSYQKNFGGDKKSATNAQSIDVSEDNARLEYIPEGTLPSEKESPSFNVAVPLRRRQKEEKEEADIVDTPVFISAKPAPIERVVQSEKPKRKTLDRPAEEELIARIARNPKDYTAYESLGDFYMERGSIQDAKECYKQVLKLSPVQRLVKIKIRRLERLLSQK